MNYDSTFCTGGKCPLKETCARYMEQPFHLKYVALFVRIPYDAKSKSCKYHIPTLTTHGEKS